MVKFWLKNILSLHKNVLKPINLNKTVKGIEKIEKEICGVFDLVLIFGCSDCGFIEAPLRSTRFIEICGSSVTLAPSKSNTLSRLNLAWNNFEMDNLDGKSSTPKTSKERRWDTFMLVLCVLNFVGLSASYIF